MFLYKNLFFSISSILSIPILLIGINGGYFPAICRVCCFILRNFDFVKAFFKKDIVLDVNKSCYLIFLSCPVIMAGLIGPLMWHYLL